MGENTFRFCCYTDINSIVDSYVPNIERIWNKSDSFDCFCGTIQIIFFYKLELKQFPDTMSRSIIFENQEQMQCVNFGFDDFFPSARKVDTCSLNQKLCFIR